MAKRLCLVCCVARWPSFIFTEITDTRERQNLPPMRIFTFYWFFAAIAPLLAMSQHARRLMLHRSIVRPEETYGRSGPYHCETGDLFEKDTGANIQWSRCTIAANPIINAKSLLWQALSTPPEQVRVRFLNDSSLTVSARTPDMAQRTIKSLDDMSLSRIKLLSSVLDVQCA